MNRTSFTILVYKMICIFRPFYEEKLPMVIIITKIHTCILGNDTWIRLFSWWWWGLRVCKKYRI